MDFEMWLVVNGKMKTINGVPCSNPSKEDILEFEEWRANQFAHDDKACQMTGYLYWKYLLYYTSISGVDINKEIDENGSTPFMIACEYGLLDLISRIAAIPNVNLNHQDTDRQETAAHRAIRYSTDECISALVDIPGIDWNIGNDMGMTPAMYAIQMIESTETLEKVLKNPQIDWNSRPDDGIPMLIRIFLIKDKERKVKCLKLMANLPGLDWNVHYTLKEDYVVCPILYASKDPDNEVMRILAEVPSINWNIKLQGRLEEHGTILNYALEQERFDFLRILFTLPNVKYDVKSLPRCDGCYDCKGRGCDTIMIWRVVLQKCLDMCRKDQKENGLNYSDVVNFLNEALKFASSHEEDIVLMKLTGFKIPGTNWK